MWACRHAGCSVGGHVVLRLNGLAGEFTCLQICICIRICVRAHFFVRITGRSEWSRLSQELLKAITIGPFLTSGVYSQHVNIVDTAAYVGRRGKMCVFVPCVGADKHALYAC